MIARMIFFEGPPGGGKSSISQFVTQQLAAADISAHWLEEHTLNSTAFVSFLATVATDPAAAVATALADWRQVVDRLHASPEVWCLDGAFFHSTLKLLLAYDYTRVQVAVYLQSLYDLLKPFAPPLILLTGDVEQIVRAAIAERGVQWATHVADDVAQYPCQQRLQRSGIEGLVSFFIESQRQLEEVAVTYPFAYQRIDTTARQWAQYQQTVCTWLDLLIQVPERPLSCDVAQYVGSYQPPSYFPPAFNHPFVVEHTPAGLRLHMVFMRNFRLIEQAPDCFAIAGRPLQLEFVRDAQGQIQGAIYPFVPEQRFVCEKIA